MDATSLGQLFTVLVLSVVYRGCAIPIAWTVLPGAAKGAWKEQWLALFTALEGVVPGDWFVLVLADRGLYAPWLFKKIAAMLWHPFLRINLGGKFRPQGQADFRPLSTLAYQRGVEWCGRVDCFKAKTISGTLLVRWGEKYEHPWVIITDIAPEDADICWYSLRAWIECGFKDTKRGGWHWEQTRITDPQRATRFWLAIAVATLWVVSVGGEEDANIPVSTLPDFQPLDSGRRTTRRSRPRLLSCFRRGILTIIASLTAHRPLPMGRFYPEPWPASVFVLDLTPTLCLDLASVPT